MCQIRHALICSFVTCQLYLQHHVNIFVVVFGMRLNPVAGKCFGNYPPVLSNGAHDGFVAGKKGNLSFNCWEWGLWPWIKGVIEFSLDGVNDIVKVKNNLSGFFSAPKYRQRRWNQQYDMWPRAHFKTCKVISWESGMFVNLKWGRICMQKNVVPSKCVAITTNRVPNTISVVSATLLPEYWERARQWSPSIIQNPGNGITV